MMLLLLLACGPAADVGATGESPDSAATDTGAQETGDGGGEDTFDLPPGECPADNGYEAQAPRTARRLSGSGTWWLDFDAAAEANGYVDCSYDRVYPAIVEQVGHDWQCPDCEWFATGEASVTRGYDDCTSLISGADATRVEHLGIGTVDGALHLFRSGSENVSLGDMGELIGETGPGGHFDAGWTDDAEFTDGSGAFVLTASLSFVVDEAADTQLVDPWVPRDSDYACGWSTCNPGGPSPALALADGQVLPNERFLDSCGDEYDLWDAWGRYVVLDASSPDCGPCQSMADNVGPWLEQMEARGLEVEWITLLNASLGDVNLSPTPETLAAWGEAFGVHGPLLADEGYAYALFPLYVGRESGMSLPTVVVVSPDMRVLGWDSGFSTEASGGAGFSVIEGLITADAATR
jgi:hypothetical protein